ncbi:MAG: xanthine dehydrogenase family protein subunit M [Firmicutes bacterium]|nr:xanthine dehydrogenase family protein subunit M [Bacillota bacterium]
MLDNAYFSPPNLNEVCELLAKHTGKAHIIAGGTDLMVKVNRRLMEPEVLININECGLSYIRKEEGNILIGAAVTMSEIIESELILEKLPMLAEAVKKIGSPAVRNVATLGGNLVNASPAADSATALLALGASFKLVSKNGERVVEGEQFFVGPGETVLKADEILKEISVPAQSEDEKWAYYKLGRRKADTLSVVSAAVKVKFDGEIVEDIRLAIGAVAPTPLLAKKTAELLLGKKLDDALIEEGARTAAEETKPQDDVRATAWYRRQACAALVKRLLGQVRG